MEGSRFQPRVDRPGALGILDKLGAQEQLRKHKAERKDAGDCKRTGAAAEGSHVASQQTTRRHKRHCNQQRVKDLCNVALDTPVYSGHTTNADSLWGG